MIPVEDALARLFALVTPLPGEEVPLDRAAGRVLRAPAQAQRDQPPFAASAMDGYAVQSPVAPGSVLQVVGEAAAGHAYPGRIGPGQALRIFTGAPVPDGADRVVIQEDVTRADDKITLRDTLDAGPYIRPAGLDFRAGDTLAAPRRLSARDLALLAAMNCPHVTVSTRPDVAIIATGDELVMPGEAPAPDQIIASNIFALKALAEAEGARAHILPIARDTEASLRAVFDLAAGADLVVTVGGASVGDHDLVGPVLQALGAERAFYKVAMRPGKPLMAGRLGRTVLLGLPGNPVSAIVCGHVFLRPLLRALQGLRAQALPLLQGRLGVDLPANGPRAHYMRARRDPQGDLVPFADQDSAILSALCQADALLLRPAADPARHRGAEISYLPL
ncbi:MAG: molybdopterin molybdotransferase MoeA [Roseinatronobacter sp.]